MDDHEGFYSRHYGVSTSGHRPSAGHYADSGPVITPHNPESLAMFSRSTDSGPFLQSFHVGFILCEWTLQQASCSHQVIIH